MAQYVPGANSSSSALQALAHAPAPDDADVQSRLPSICVDYLSHDWAEEDVWASWRSMTRQKNEIANGLRLENASWRTWWKQRNRLRTISPETLNWLKDSDVTWLYGPLHTAVEAVPPPKIATAEERLNLVSAGGKKPILKHRTISEMLTIPLPSSPVLESIDFNSDEENISEGGDSQPGSFSDRPVLLQTKSDTNIVRKGNKRLTSPPRGPILESSIKAQEGEGVIANGKRHISFNTFVEQCISLDEPTTVTRPDGTSAVPGLEHVDEDAEDSDDDVLEMRSSSSASSSRPSMSRQNSMDNHITIAKIAPTMLKSNEIFPAPSPAVVFVPPSSYSPSQSPYQSPYGVPGARDYHIPPSGVNYDFPSPSSNSIHWDDEDDDFSVGFDYFSGPNNVVSSGNGAVSPGVGVSVPAHVGSVGHYAQGTPTSNSAKPTIVIPNSNNSSQNSSTVNSSGIASTKQSPSPAPPSTDPPQVKTTASYAAANQPARSILKNRSAGGEGPTIGIAIPPRDASAPEYNYSTHVNTLPSAVSPRSYILPGETPPMGSPDPNFYGTPPLGSPSLQQEPSTRGRSSIRSSSTSSLADRSPGNSRSASQSVSTSPGGARLFGGQSSAPWRESPVESSPVLSGPSPGGRTGNRPPSIKTVAAGGVPLRPATPASSDGLNSPSVLSPKSGEVEARPWAATPEKPTDSNKSQPSPAAADPGENQSNADPGQEGYEFTTSTNPTPNSSPSITMRPLFDSSAASLPHSSTPVVRPTTTPVTGPIQRAVSSSSSTGSFLDDGSGAEGGSIAGRAANVVATARDLLSSLWGQGAPPTPTSSTGPSSVATDTVKEPSSA